MEVLDAKSTVRDAKRQDAATQCNHHRRTEAPSQCVVAYGDRVCVELCAAATSDHEPG